MSAAAGEGEFTLERAARARKLAEESPEHSGGTDLLVFADSVELTQATNLAFCTEDGQRRQGLGERQKLQGLVTFCRSMLAKMQLPSATIRYFTPCYQAMVAAVNELMERQEQAASGYSGAMVPVLPTTLLAKLADGALFIVEDPTAAFGSPHDPADARSQQRGALATCQPMAERWEESNAAGIARELEKVQRMNGFDPVLTAQQARTLALLLARTAAHYLGVAAGRLGQKQEEEGYWQTAVSMTRRLVALHPASPAFQYQLCSAQMRLSRMTAQSAASARAALRLAEAANDHWLASAAAMLVAQHILFGAEGNECIVLEVQGLLDSADRHSRLCKAWLPPALTIKGPLAIFKEQFAAAKAARPGAATVPALPQRGHCLSTEPQLAQVVKKTCSSCGLRTYQLKTCASCKRTAYCSKECQVKHWKEGHKAECAALAAARRET